MLTPANPHLPFPHSSQVEGELRELRCHYGRELYRILYQRSANLVILLHMFRKDTGKLPPREIEIGQRALDRLQTADGRQTPPASACRRSRRTLTPPLPILINIGKLPP